MEIRITLPAMTMLRGQYSHIRLTEDEAKELVSYSWSQAEEKNIIVYNEKQNEAVFCLCAENKNNNAVFVYARKHFSQGWFTYRIYYRVPGSCHPVNDNDYFVNMFESFSDLEARIEELSDMRLIGWEPARSKALIGPEAADISNIIKDGVHGSFSEYTSRIYSPNAFGFSTQTQEEIIVDSLLATYENARKDGKLFGCDNYLCCMTEMTNANSEKLFLIISTDPEDYRAEICSYGSVEGLFHGDAGEICAEIKIHCPRGWERDKSLMWQFARFTIISGQPKEYQDLYTGQGVASGVRLLSETWSFDSPGDINTEIRCLGNYLEGTFLRLLYEDKIWILDGNRKRTDDPSKKTYAVFNTGLVDISYIPIYMIFKLVRNRWLVDSFTTAGNGVLNGFDESECPPKADYICGEVLRTMYCTDGRKVSNWRTPKVSMDHVLENFDRLPQPVQQYCLGERYEQYRSYLIANDEDNAQTIVQTMTDEKKRRLSREFDDALKLAISRAAWNIRTGVPVYYYKDGSVNVLLPLAMQRALDFELGNAPLVDSNSMCDTAALMVLTEDTTSDRKGVFKYECKPLFSLSMAYRDARLINRPESDWLKPIEHV